MATTTKVSRQTFSVLAAAPRSRNRRLPTDHGVAGTTGWGALPDDPAAIPTGTQPLENSAGWLELLPVAQQPRESARSARRRAPCSELTPDCLSQAGEDGSCRIAPRMEAITCPVTTSLTTKHQRNEEEVKSERYLECLTVSRQDGGARNPAATAVVARRRRSLQGDRADPAAPRRPMTHGRNLSRSPSLRTFLRTASAVITPSIRSCRVHDRQRQRRSWRATNSAASR